MEYSRPIAIGAIILAGGFFFATSYSFHKRVDAVMGARVMLFGVSYNVIDGNAFGKVKLLHSSGSYVWVSVSTVERLISNPSKTEF